jgi:hypothetical protein
MSTVNCRLRGHIGDLSHSTGSNCRTIEGLTAIEDISEGSEEIALVMLSL